MYLFKERLKSIQKISGIAILALPVLAYLYARIMVKSVFWILFLFAVSVSCLNEPDCFLLNNNIVGISFRTLLNDSTSEVRSDTFLTVSAVGAKEAIVTNGVGSKLAVPLNFFNDSTKVVFQILEAGGGVIDSILFDTLILQYNAQAQFVSEDCGERFVLSNLTIVKHTFDSVRLVNRTPGRDETSNHIEIVFE
jgi:hypothetical protein